MTATVIHQPKAGATLTGTDYEAADHHVLVITPADIGAAANTHDHAADYAAADHAHEGGLTHPQALARGLGA